MTPKELALTIAGVVFAGVMSGSASVYVQSSVAESERKSMRKEMEGMRDDMKALSDKLHGVDNRVAEVSAQVQGLRDWMVAQPGQLAGISR